MAAARPIGALAPLLMLAACATRDDVSNPPVVELRGGTIAYQGGLEASAVEEVRRLLEAGNRVDTLAISSPGGELNVGMDLGELVHRFGLNVRVTGWGCMSSCANYVFPAGRTKSIEPGAAVAWHGSAIQKNLGRGLYRLYPPMRRYVSEVRARQAAFYERIGVDARVTIAGHELDCRCVWLLSPEDMQRFGIDDVHVPADYGMAQPHWRQLGLRLIRLADHPDYAATLRGAR